MPGACARTTTGLARIVIAIMSSIAMSDPGVRQQKITLAFVARERSAGVPLGNRSEVAFDEGPRPRRTSLVLGFSC